jgi:hypothetical protein
MLIIDTLLSEECKAFLNAWLVFGHWGPGQSEPRVWYSGQAITITEAFKLVLDRSDMIVPEGFYDGTPFFRVGSNFEPTLPTYSEATHDALDQVAYRAERLKMLTAH